MMGQYDRGGGGLAHAVIVGVLHHADDLAPVVVAGHTNPLAQGSVGVMPVLASEIFGDDGHRPLLVGVCPGDVAPGDELRAHSGEETGRDEFEAAYRGQLALAIDMVLREHGVIRTAAIHGNGGGEGGGGSSRVWRPAYSEFPGPCGPRDHAQCRVREFPRCRSGMSARSQGR